MPSFIIFASGRIPPLALEELISPTSIFFTPEAENILNFEIYLAFLNHTAVEKQGIYSNFRSMYHL